MPPTASMGSQTTTSTALLMMSSRQWRTISMASETRLRGLSDDELRGLEADDELSGYGEGEGLHGYAAGDESDIGLVPSGSQRIRHGSVRRHGRRRAEWITAGDDLDGFADDDLNGFADDELRGIGDDERMSGYVRDGRINGIEGYRPDGAPRTPAFSPAANAPMWAPLW